jgi:hypothetical protein
MNKDDLRHLIEEADIAFWAVIAKHFPEAKTGDLSIDRTIRLTIAEQEAVKEWIANNVTTQEGDIAAGYRFRLFQDVDRFPDFLAPIGMTGIVTAVDDGGVWGRMDQHIAGSEHWDNQIHWQTPEEFARDTVPM